MAKLIVMNFKSETINLGIEPWADVEAMAPHEKVEIEYNEPAEIDFSLDEDGGATIGIVSDRVVVRGRTERTHTPPPGDW